ncbi:hypothetical protein LJR098_006121 [Rhizobium sp. LjRoot98]|uniref:hypothetical protein n=1 Tax=Rhizobium sp. LjRoot98 TaxID=3342345 RepID=UPI003ED172E2
MLHWSRLAWVEIVPPCHNILLAHLFLFASRVTFFFGGALFSAVFFRHFPELEVFPPLWQAVAKALYVVAVLFGLFCVSLELDRLGRAMEEPHVKGRRHFLRSDRKKQKYDENDKMDDAL